MKNLVIGVAGGTGSGKTTVADEIVRRVGREHMTVLNHDRYYHDLSDHSPEALLHHNFDHPLALDTGLMVTHLAMLRAGEPAPLPVYDFTRHVRLDRVEWVTPGHPLFDKPHRIASLAGLECYDTVAHAGKVWAVLLRDDGGRPAILEAKVGAGRVLVIEPNVDQAAADAAKRPKGMAPDAAKDFMENVAVYAGAR